MIIKAISLWQPWAHFMMLGLKKNETRGWRTHHRGPLVICAAKTKGSLWDWPDETIPERAKMQFGCVVALVDLIECIPTENFIRSADKAKLPLRTISQSEWKLGDYTPGRFAWITRNLRIPTRPIPVIGRQSLFDVDIDLTDFAHAPERGLQAASR